MSSTYGEHLKLSIFGQSHGPAIGMVLDGIPGGLPVDQNVLSDFLRRRAPGQNAYSTPRKEGDVPEFKRSGKRCDLRRTHCRSNPQHQYAVRRL